MDFDTIYFFICALGTLNSILFALYLLFVGKGNRRSRIFLSIILLLFSIRIIEKVLIYYSIELYDFYHFLWFIAFGYTGQMIWFYVRMFPDIYKPIKKADFLHLVIPSANFILAFISHDTKVGFVLFYLNILLFFIYTFLSVVHVFGNRRQLKTKSTKKFLFTFSIWAFLIPIAYALSIIIRKKVSDTEAIYFSMTLYVLIYMELSQNRISKAADKKYSSNIISEDTISRIKERLINYLEQDKNYLNSDISMSIVAKSLKFNTNNLSRVINESMNTTFSDLINGYRIKHAKKMLTHPNHRNKKIAFIAYECGFNSISVFNNAFKKHTGLTPSSFQKKVSM